MQFETTQPTTPFKLPPYQKRQGQTDTEKELTMTNWIQMAIVSIVPEHEEWLINNNHSATFRKLLSEDSTFHALVRNTFAKLEAGEEIADDLRTIIERVASATLH